MGLKENTNVHFGYLEITTLIEEIKGYIKW
jgi:hypothetical protein